MKTIQELYREAQNYASNYNSESKDAIFWSHLAYLINQQIAK